jgi:hypothetical protein
MRLGLPSEEFSKINLPMFQKIQNFLSGNTKTPTQGEVDSGFTESPNGQTQECKMFTIQDHPKPPTKEAMLRVEFMETVNQLKAGQYFDVPYNFEGMGKADVVKCVHNYLGQFRKALPEGKAVHYTMKNCKKERGGYSRIAMYSYE